MISTLRGLPDAEAEPTVAWINTQLAGIHITPSLTASVTRLSSDRADRSLTTTGWSMVTAATSPVTARSRPRACTCNCH